MAITKDTPNYTIQQIEDMDKAYPEPINPNMTQNEVYFQMGARAVIKYMKAVHEYHRKRANGGQS